jgi:lysine 6-dehydrogenase
MKIAILGTGVTGKVVAREIISTATNVDVLLADLNAENAAELATALNSDRVSSIGCDARKEDSLRSAIAGVDLVINAAHHEVNRNVMAACLDIGAHYLDLGGLFHETREQLCLDSDFQKAGLTGVLGMGAAPGMTNILANLLCSKFDSVESIDACYAAGNDYEETDSDVFVPPYSIHTLLSEFGDPSFQFVDGELQTFGPKTGRERMHFPDPIGAVDCFHTLHSEPATLPAFFAEKGIRRVTWRLALPKQIEKALDCFISAGLNTDEPIEIDGFKISPVAVLSACIERNARGKAQPIKAHKEIGCIRVVATGKIGGRRVASRADCILELAGEPRNVAAEITGRPAAAAALMIVRGEARRPGVHGPEAVIPADEMLTALSKRDFELRQTTQSDGSTETLFTGTDYQQVVGG